MPPFTFGPLIDAPPSHPDTIVTTLDYCKNYSQSLGMNTVHITLDMQLYMVAIQVKWSDPEKWATLVIHPGEMHCFMSFLGCIGKLMRGSGLEELIGAAFSGLTGILNGKNCWVTSCIKREVYPHLTMCQSFLRRPASHQLGSCGWIVSLGQLWLHTCLLELNAKATGSCMCTAFKRCFPASLQLVIGTMHDTPLSICKKWAVCPRMPSLISWLVLLYLDIGKVCETLSKSIWGANLYTLWQI